MTDPGSYEAVRNPKRRIVDLTVRVEVGQSVSDEEVVYAVQQGLRAAPVGPRLWAIHRCRTQPTPGAPDLQAQHGQEGRGDEGSTTRGLDAAASGLCDPLAPASRRSERVSLPARGVIAMAVALLAVAVTALPIMAALGWLS